jgi:hypothetical protein
MRVRSSRSTRIPASSIRPSTSPAGARPASQCATWPASPRRLRSTGPSASTTSASCARVLRRRRDLHLPGARADCPLASSDFAAGSIAAHTPWRPDRARAGCTSPGRPGTTRSSCRRSAPPAPSPCRVHDRGSPAASGRARTSAARIRRQPAHQLQAAGSPSAAPTPRNARIDRRGPSSPARPPRARVCTRPGRLEQRHDRHRRSAGNAAITAARRRRRRRHLHLDVGASSTRASPHHR